MREQNVPDVLKQIDKIKAVDLPVKKSRNMSNLLNRCNSEIKKSKNKINIGYQTLINSSFMVKNTISRMVKGKDYLLERLLLKDAKEMTKFKGLFLYGDKNKFVNTKTLKKLD